MTFDAGAVFRKAQAQAQAEAASGHIPAASGAHAPPYEAVGANTPEKRESASRPTGPKAQTKPPSGDPIPLGDDLLPVAALDPEILPDGLRTWLTDSADRMQAPLDFPAAGAVVAAGSAIGRRCGIRPQAHTDWIVVPNIWGGIIGRPAMMKSPTLSTALAPLKALEVAAAAENEDRLTAYAKDVKLFELREKAAAENAKGAIKAAMKKGEEVGGIGLVEATEPPRPPLIRYVLNDATYEKAGEIMADNPAGILVVRDEITGFLKPLDREENAAARGFWLQAWNGDDGYTFDRIIRGTVRIEACCAGVIGGIQPGKLAAYLRAAVTGGSGDDGLMQRFGVLVWPDQSPEWRNVDRWPNTQAKADARAIYKRLVAIDGRAIGAERDEYDHFPSLRFCTEALRLFTEWREDLEKRLRIDGLHPALESHLAKYRKLIPALALTFHLIDHPKGGPVSATATMRALAWAEYLEPHARRAYAAVALPERAGAKTIWRRLNAGDLPPQFSARDIQRRGWTGLSTPEDIRASLEVLLAHNLLFVEAIPSSQTGGRPAERFSVNPAAVSS